MERRPSREHVVFEQTVPIGECRCEVGIGQIGPGGACS